MHEVILINTDGGSRGNPGKAAIGIVIRDENNKVLEKYKEKIGITTNNVAEYKALIKGLELASKYTKEGNKEIKVFMDSELIVRQLTGVYRVKQSHLISLFENVKKLESKFKKISYTHVFREDKYQTEADKLVNEALDGA